MKTIIYSVLVLMLFSFGCTDTDINNPKQLKDKVSLMKLPPRISSLSMETVITVSEQINGSVGGTVILSEVYQAPFGEVTLDLELDIPAGSFYGTETISITMDGEYAYFYIEPELGLTSSLFFSCSFTGLDLGTDPKAEFEFVYIEPDDHIMDCPYDTVSWDIYTGSLSVENAVISVNPQDSRYGWATVDGGGE